MYAIFDELKKKSQTTIRKMPKPFTIYLPIITIELKYLLFDVLGGGHQRRKICTIAWNEQRDDDETHAVFVGGETGEKKTGPND